MSPEYLETLNGAWECIRRVSEAAAGKYGLVVTADHGMDRFGIHGGPTEEQRTIPLYIFSAAAVPGRFQEEEISQLNLAPLLCRLLGLPPAPGMREGLEVKLTDL